MPVKKKKSVKNHKTVIAFDEQSRMEFVQGMRKRKNQRRKKACDAIVAKMKRERKAYDKKKRELIMAEIATLENQCSLESEASETEENEALPTIPGLYLCD